MGGKITIIVKEVH